MIHVILPAIEDKLRENLNLFPKICYSLQQMGYGIIEISCRRKNVDSFAYLICEFGESFV